MKKRLLAALVCVALVVSLLPHTARADNDSPKTLYFESDGQTGCHQLLILDLTTGVKAPYPPGGTWSVSGNTLTLKNFNFTTSAPTVLSMQHNTELKIEGDNSLTSTYDGDGYHEYFVCGLHCAGNLTVSGSGALTVTGGSDGSGNQSCGIQMGTITMTGGTLTAYGNMSALRSEVSGNCLTVGPAGDGKGLMCCYSSNVGETDWRGKMMDAVYGDNNTIGFSNTSSYFTNHSVRISEVSAVSGTVKDAAGNPVNGFSLYLNGASPQTYTTGPEAGAYRVYVENGTHTLSAEKGSTIGTRSIAVNGAALSGQDITLENAPTPGITVSPAATFPLHGAPDDLTLLVGNTGNTPNRAAHFGSLEISSDNVNFTTVDPANYSLQYGSIRIGLAKSWLDTLALGTYTLRVKLAGVYADISPTTTLTVTAPGITVSPTATFPQGGAPDHLTLLVGSAGNPPDRAAHFGSLEISGDNTNFTTVDSGDYSLRYGSIHIEMSQSFLNTLTPGTYTLRVNLAGVYAGLSPTIQLNVTAPGGDAGAESDVPKTGDAATPMLWLGLILLSGAGLAVSAACKRRAAKLR